MKYFIKTAISTTYVDDIANAMKKQVTFLPAGQTRTALESAKRSAKAELIDIKAHQIKNRRKYFIQDKTDQAYRNYEATPSNWPEIKLRKEMQGL